MTSRTGSLLALAREMSKKGWWHMKKEHGAALALLQQALRQAAESGLLDVLAADVRPDSINALCDAVNALSAAERPQANGDVVAVDFSRDEMEIVRVAVQEYREQMLSPTSADRAANGDDWADREAQACDELLNSKLKVPPVVERNVLGQVAAKPFYIWADEDCDNKTDSLKEAKAIRLELFNAGREDVYIADADGVEMVDAEIEAHEALADAGYFAGVRNPEVNPGFPGAFMVNDPRDAEGFAIVGDDVAALILEAKDHLFPSEHERLRG